MLYLLDANVLIDANRNYYPIEAVPEFWEWLVHIGTVNTAKIPVEIYEEITTGDLADWTKRDDITAALMLNEDVDSSLVSRITDEGYADDLTDDEVVKIGRDPFLIAYALADVNNRCVVTREVSKPSRIRANRHLPDVCNDLGVKWCNTFDFTRTLNFKTGWKGS